MIEKRDPGGASTATDPGTTGAIADVDHRDTIAATTIIRPPSAVELSALAVTFAELRASVEKEAEPEVKDQALERVEELEEAVKPAAPDVSVMAATRNWFLKYAPQLAEAVTGVIVHPTTARIVHAAGNALGRDYREKFPSAQDVPAAGGGGG